MIAIWRENISNGREEEKTYNLSSILLLLYLRDSASISMDQELKSKYEKSKLIVVKWEKEFRKSKNRIPSKVSKIFLHSKQQQQLNIFLEFSFISLT